MKLQKTRNTTFAIIMKTKKIILIVLLLAMISYGRSQSVVKDSTVSAKDVIRDVRELRCHSDTARMNDIIVIELSTLVRSLNIVL